MGLADAGPGTRTAFSDFNEEVLREVTAPNVAHNVGGGQHVRYYAGDWLALTRVLEEEEEEERGGGAARVV